MELVTTVTGVIDALGGVTKAGLVVGLSPHAVGMWQTRGGIPSEYFLVISAALRKEGKVPAPDVFPWLKQPAIDIEQVL